MSDVTTVFLGGLYSFVEARVLEQGYTPAEAENAGVAVVVKIKTAWVSGSVYITKASRYHHLLMARDVYRDFNGTNHSDLCEKYGKSVPQIYTIIRRMRVEYISHLQRDMFDDSEPDNSKIAEFLRLGLETLSQLMAMCREGLHETIGISDSIASSIGEQLAEWAAQKHGGKFIYIKSDSAQAPDDTQGNLFTE